MCDVVSDCSTHSSGQQVDSDRTWYLVFYGMRAMKMTNWSSSAHGVCLELVSKIGFECLILLAIASSLDLVFSLAMR